MGEGVDERSLGGNPTKKKEGSFSILKIFFFFFFLP
jgi:hypothetical protein